MSEECGVLHSYGICKLCDHNVFDDKSHPAWMACQCREPEIEQPEVKAQPPTYDDYGC